MLVNTAQFAFMLSRAVAFEVVFIYFDSRETTASVGMLSECAGIPGMQLVMFCHL